MDEYLKLKKPILENPTDIIMSAGGDDRILLNERSGLNKYGCNPYPENVIAYASSTASTISAAAYSIVEARHPALISESKNFGEIETYHKSFQEIRNRLKAAYSISNSVSLAFGASGTDLEIAVLAITLASEESKAHNIVVAPEEVGSGTEFAARGQHFADHTALGNSVTKGSQIEGFNESDITIGMVEVRSEQGTPLDESEIINKIELEIDWAKKNGARPIIHLVHRTKTGLIVPSWDSIQYLKNKYDDQIDLVVDACQGRIAPETLNRYLSSDFMVIFTGSKFIGGAPFSGVLFVPEKISERFKKAKNLPKGLGHFFTRHEWPTTWKMVDDILPKKMNYGLLLRWESALYELERILSLSENRVSNVIKLFQKSVEKLVDSTDFLSLTGTPKNVFNEKEILHHPFEKDMIMTLVLEGDNPISKEKLDIEDAKLVHKGLYSNLSSLLQEENNNYSSLVIHVGQPVKCVQSPQGNWRGTLRIALGAPLISDIAMLNENVIKNRFDADMDRLLKKMEFVLTHFRELQNL